VHPGPPPPLIGFIHFNSLLSTFIHPNFLMFF
jgi:hypothetical protein